MVSGANNIFKTAAPTFTIGAQEPSAYKVGTAEAKTVQGPNYAQYDTYRSPVTTGVSGDNFDMMM